MRERKHAASPRGGADSQRAHRDSRGSSPKTALLGLGAVFCIAVLLIVMRNGDPASEDGSAAIQPPQPPPTTSAAKDVVVDAPIATDSNGNLEWTDACTPSPYSDMRSVKSAKAYLKQRVDQLLSYGPRVAGSNSRGSIEVNRMITAMAQCDGMWTVEHDNFTQNTVIGSRSFSNIVSTFEFGNPELGHLVLSAHWDSKLYDDMYFVGACDSAVPCIQILEIMKVVSAAAKKEKAAKPSLTVSEKLPKITVMFFDGEEAFVDWKGEDNTYGSRHLAQVWEADGRLKTISLFILVDLTGPANPVFHNYFAQKSGGSYQRLRNIEIDYRKRGAAQTRAIMEASFFPKELRSDYKIEDDHIPWLNRGVPILHLIPVPFPPGWHKASDDGASIDYSTTYDLTRILQNFTVTYKKVRRARK